MIDPQIAQFAFVALGSLGVAAGVYAIAYPYLSGDVANEKRRARVTEGHARRAQRVASAEQASHRRKAVADTLKELEERQNSKEKVTLRLKLERAGLEITPNTFWALSAGAGVATGILVWVLFPSTPMVGLVIACFVGVFGLPRWLLSQLIKRRQKKFTKEFANSIDVIVRGIKTGLPLNECLQIIAKESPPPVRGEFQDLVDQQRVGVPLSEGFERMMARMPLAEVKFFAIVVGIQQQAGGNLSEALENLSSVLRDRQKLAAKVQAMSAEAKASALVLGALPFCVAAMVYFTTPAYIALLWTNKYGIFMLMGCAVWMFMGIMVMKKMIDFKY